MEAKKKGKQKQHEHNSGRGSFQVERTDAIKMKEIKLTDQFALLGFVGFNFFFRPSDFPLWYIVGKLYKSTLTCQLTFVRLMLISWWNFIIPAAKLQNFNFLVSFGSLFYFFSPTEVYIIHEHLGMNITKMVWDVVCRHRQFYCQSRVDFGVYFLLHSHKTKFNIIHQFYCQIREIWGFPTWERDTHDNLPPLSVYTYPLCHFVISCYTLRIRIQCPVAETLASSLGPSTWIEMQRLSTYTAAHLAGGIRLPTFWAANEAIWIYHILCVHSTHIP